MKRLGRTPGHPADTTTWRMRADSSEIRRANGAWGGGGGGQGERDVAPHLGHGQQLAVRHIRRIKPAKGTPARKDGRIGEVGPSATWRSSSQQ